MVRYIRQCEKQHFPRNLKLTQAFLNNNSTDIEKTEHSSTFVKTKGAQWNQKSRSLFYYLSWLPGQLCGMHHPSHECAACGAQKYQTTSGKTLQQLCWHEAGDRRCHYLTTNPQNSGLFVGTGVAVHKGERPRAEHKRWVPQPAAHTEFLIFYPRDKSNIVTSNSYITLVQTLLQE